MWMTRYRFIVSLALIAVLAMSSSSYTVPIKTIVLTDAQSKCILDHINYDLELNPAYLWGGASLEPGAEKDCSGSIYSYFASCGVAEIIRTTAARMHAGKDGWGAFHIIAYNEAHKLAIVIMTCTADRPNGHVGILYSDVQYGVAKMAHASSKYGFIAVILRSDKKGNYYFPRITRIRQVIP